MEDIIIIGFGGHAKSVCDTIESIGQFNIVGYTDNEDKKSKYVYLGTDDVLEDYFKKGIKYLAMGIGYLGKINIRERIYTYAKDIGYQFPVIIDKTAIVSENATINEGTFVGKGVIVNVEAKIGKMCIINTGAIIEHECRVGDFTHIAVGAVLCGQVTIGDRCLIGANATVIQQQEVKSMKIIPAGGVVRRLYE